MGAEGLEPDTASAEPADLLRQASPASAANSGALLANFGPDLARLVEAWPTLPVTVRAGIVAMVKAATSASEVEHERTKKARVASPLPEWLDEAVARLPTPTD